MLPRAARQFTDRIRPPIGCASHHRLDRGGGSARSERISDLVDVFRNARAALTSTRRPRALGVARRPRVVRRATEMSFAVWGCAPAHHRAFFAGASVPRVSRARSGTWTPRGRRPRLGAVAILRPDLPQPPREPTWQDRLENLKEYGENDGPLGRKNRGPRRRIRRTVSKPRIAPNSVDDKIRAWNESRGVSPPSEPSPASTSSNAIPASATPAPPSIAQGPFQREEIRTYSFLGQSEVRYPAASLRDPASRAVYADSDVDKIAIAVSAKQLAEAAGVEVTTLGDPSNYDTLARAAKALRDSRGPGALRQTVSELMRGQIRAGVPPLPGLSGMMQTLIPPEMMREMNATVASEAAEWMFGPTTRETMAGPNGGDVTVVNVKKCRYLEATGCAGVCVNMCKLPAQDVMASEFGVPVYMAPNFETGGCRMFFGQEPLPESVDPAMRAPCSALCADAERFSPKRPTAAAETGADGFPVASAWVEPVMQAPVLDRCGALPARARA